jgi:hypothetical protein
VQPVHDQHDRPPRSLSLRLYRVWSYHFVRRLALGLAEPVLGLQGVVDDDRSAPHPVSTPPDRGSDAAALRGRLELRHHLPGPRFDQRSRDA